MKVIKINAREVFKDDNEGFLYGLQDNEDFPFYIEWFKTKKEREETIKINNMEVIN